MTTATVPARPRAANSASDAATTTWTERTVGAISRRLSSSRLGRRSFLTRAALVGSALAVDPVGFLIRPQSAWASVCGVENECNEGWSAFCATINDGANTCPSGSYPAGWWKIDNTTFCSGRARYIVDCNRSPGASCSCRCANGDCDRRRVCCNNFRYGQCNTQVRGTTEVVCRIVLCTPPWEWGNCTTTSATSNGTRTHWSSRLPSRTNPTPIKVRWLELGLNGSLLGRLREDERVGRRNGSFAVFDNGVMTNLGNSTVYLTGPHADAYLDQNGPRGWTGYPLRDTTGNPEVVRYDNGSTYQSPWGIHAVFGGLDDYYRSQGGPRGWMGPPSDHATIPGGPWRTVPTASGWTGVWNETRGEGRALRLNEGLGGDGVWPPLARVRASTGNDDFSAAVAVSRATHPDGARTVLVAAVDHDHHTYGAGAAAGRLDAPILLVNRSSVPRATADEIRRLDPDRVVLLGPTTVLYSSVARELNGLADDVVRWAHPRRLVSAVVLSQRTFPSAEDVLITHAQARVLAMVGAPLANHLGAPMLTVLSRLPDVTADEIVRLGAQRATVIGSEDKVSPAVVDDLRNLGLDVRRIDGRSSDHTAANVFEAFPNVRTVVTNFGRHNNLLIAASLGVHGRMPILPVTSRNIPGPTDRRLLQQRPDVIRVAGRRDQVSSDMYEAMRGYPA